MIGAVGVRDLWLVGSGCWLRLYMLFVFVGCVFYLVC